jgi:hypothetical protein
LLLGLDTSNPRFHYANTRRSDTLFWMKGKDGNTHSLTVGASSLFQAAQQGIEAWSLLWWFDPEELITVQVGDQRWAVRQGNVRRRWRTER